MGYKTKKSLGASSKLSTIAKNNLVRKTSKKNIYLQMKLRKSSNLKVSVSRVQQVLRDTSHLQYKKMKFAPALTAVIKMPY